MMLAVAHEEALITTLTLQGGLSFTLLNLDLVVVLSGEFGKFIVQLALEDGGPLKGLVRYEKGDNS